MKVKPFSKIIAGTMTWGVWGKNCDTKQMIELMQSCLETTLQLLTMPIFMVITPLKLVLEKHFAESKIERDKIQLISKCGIQMLSKERKNTVKHYEYSSSYIIWSVEQSLKNLQTDYLDLLLLHRPSPLMDADEIAKAIEKLKQEGKIIDFGVSNFTPLQSDLIETKTKIAYNQIEFSITHFEAMLDGSLNHMQTRGIQPMSWSPLGSVFKKENEQSLRVKKLAESLAVKYELSVDIILLAWILKHPAGILPVCGTADPARIANLTKACKVEMELQDWFALWSESAGTPVP